MGSIQDCLGILVQLIELAKFRQGNCAQFSLQTAVFLTGGNQHALFVNKPALLVGSLLALMLGLFNLDSDKI
jgi:hypothetical protein